jgi:NADH-quinone oxidoreductase subunit N
VNEKPLALLPEALLLAGAIGGLLLGLFLPRRRQWLVRVVAAGALVASIVAALAAAGDLAGPVFDGVYDVDTATTVVRVVAAAATLLVLALAAGELAGSPRETELYTLMLLGTLGTVLLAGADDLLFLGAAYLLASIPLYGLAALTKSGSGTEAALKYYLLGAFLGIVMLAGTVVLYGVGRSTRYPELTGTLVGAPSAAVAFGGLGVLTGLLFKLGGVPAHFWVPDVAEGATTTVAAFVTTVPKVGAVGAVYRLLDGPLADAPGDWPLVVAVLATLSMTLGNLAAFFQDSVKRLLGYSTVSQVGYLLMVPVVAGRSDLALPSLALYLAAYAATNTGAFAVVVAARVGPTVQDWQGFARRSPALAVALVVCLLGLVGTPPTGVFVGKLTVFSATADGGYGWLVVVAAVNTVLSLFYYLRWLAPVFRRGSDDGRVVTADPEPWSATAALVAATASVAVGLGAGIVLAGVSA